MLMVTQTIFCLNTCNRYRKPIHNFKLSLTMYILFAAALQQPLHFMFPGLVSGGAASSDDDVTTYSVLVDGKKVTRSTRKSSLGQANTDGSSDQSTRNIHDRNTVAPGKYCIFLRIG